METATVLIFQRCCMQLTKQVGMGLHTKMNGSITKFFNALITLNYDDLCMLFRAIAIGKFGQLYF